MYAHEYPSYAGSPAGGPPCFGGRAPVFIYTHIRETTGLERISTEEIIRRRARDYGELLILEFVRAAGSRTRQRLFVSVLGPRFGFFFKRFYSSPVGCNTKRSGNRRPEQEMVVKRRKHFRFSLVYYRRTQPIRSPSFPIRVRRVFRSVAFANEKPAGRVNTKRSTYDGPIHGGVLKPKFRWVGDNF